MVAEDLNKLRRQAATSQHYSDMLRYRDALKRSGAHQGVLDLSLPHKWELIQDWESDYGQLRTILQETCRDDQGLQPFFGTKARPLTIKESMQARIDQYIRSEGKDLSLWTVELGTCSGVVYEFLEEGKRPKCIKLEPLSPRLLHERCDNWMVVDSFADYPGKPIWIDWTNEKLSVEEIRLNKGWLALVEGDVKLLEQYLRICEGIKARHFSTRFSVGDIILNGGKSGLESLTLLPIIEGGGVSRQYFYRFGRLAQFARIAPP